MAAERKNFHPDDARPAGESSRRAEAAERIHDENGGDTAMPAIHDLVTSYARHLHPTVVQYLNDERIAREYDEYFRNNRLFAYDCQVLLENLPGGGRVLDAGCGSGRHLVFLERNGFEAYGLDLSRHFLAVARDKLQAQGLPVRLRQGDLVSPPTDLLPAPLKFSGIILMFSVLGMIRGAENRKRALRELRNWLQPGGRLIAHVHNRKHSVSFVMEKLQQLRGIFTGENGMEAGDRIIHNYRGILDLYLHSFALDELEQLLREAGFRIRSIIALNHSRDGICTTNNPAYDANGFIAVAEPDSC